MNEFLTKKFIVVKNFIQPEVAKFLYEYLKFSSQILIASGDIKAIEGDVLVSGCLGARSHDQVFDTLLKISKSKIETITGLELFPTYTYARLYKTGNIMKPHRDRPSCEISVTLKLSDTGNYNWPIFMDGNKIELEDGDAVLYRGCELEHWRNYCERPDYYLGQVFMHYVDKNGPNAEYKYDKHYHRSVIYERDITNG
jgi:hypothetical protein